MLGLALKGLKINTEKSRNCYSVQIDLSGHIKSLAIQMRHCISELDVMEAELQPHVTVCYGIQSNSCPYKIRKIVEVFNSFNIKCGAIGIFENQCFDVVYISIQLNEILNRLNKNLSALPSIFEYDIYIPHITLAYVKKGAGKKYVTMENLLFDKEFNVKQIVISRVDYVNELVSLV